MRPQISIWMLLIAIVRLFVRPGIISMFQDASLDRMHLTHVTQPLIACTPGTVARNVILTY
jgi:hypothetical protein